LFTPRDLRARVNQERTTGHRRNSMYIGIGTLVLIILLILLLT
jgi:hypothetical protein